MGIREIPRHICEAVWHEKINESYGRESGYRRRIPVLKCKDVLQKQKQIVRKSNIQWCDFSWNIARGCTKLGADCKFCYMYRDSLGSKRYNPLEIKRTKTVFNMPLKIKETKSNSWDGRPLVFTCSLTDFFHEGIDSFRNEAWDIIRKCPHLIFQILTKRPERITACLPADWGDGWHNVWLGTSCGSQESTYRIHDLLAVKAKTKFLSLEPLHGEIDLSDIYGLWDKEKGANQPETLALLGIDWVIVGGESGNEIGKYRYRPCDIKWIENIVSVCKTNNVPVFVKQFGTFLAKQMGMKKHGGDIVEFPEHLQIRQFPNTKNK